MFWWQWALIALGVYLLLGAATVWACYKDIIAPKWWAWLVVVVAWPLFWYGLFA